MNDAATSTAVEVGSRWKPYPAYKNSGVEWLGEIPGHWEVKRLKFLTSFVTSGSRGWAQYYSENGAIFLRIGNLSRTSINLDLRDIQHVCPPQDAEGERTRVNPHDVLISITAYIGSVALVAEDIGEAYVNQHIALTRPRKEVVIPRWLGYCLLSKVGQEQFSLLLYGGTKDGLGLDDVNNLLVLTPPIGEQRTIANFLDRETAPVDTLIAKKEQLIELLTEKRSTLISHVVTKGLDPTVPMKDSGVEWLGEIPAPWNVKRNKAIFREHNLRSVSGAEELLTVSHITGVTRRSEKTVTMIEAESHEDYKLCASGDLVINTMWCWMGALGIAWESGMVSPSYNVYRPIKPNLCARYFDYLCRIPVYVSELTRYSKGVWKSRLRLYPDEFLLICAPLPDLVEQRDIASFLDHETAKIDALITKVREHIEKLKEYRSAIISAAVTGKIDVREEVPS